MVFLAIYPLSIHYGNRLNNDFESVGWCSASLFAWTINVFYTSEGSSPYEVHYYKGVIAFILCRDF